MEYFRFWKCFCQMCEKLGHFWACTAFRNHTCSSAYVSPVQEGIWGIEDEVKGRISRERYISSFQSIPKEGLRLSPGKSSVYSRAYTVEEEVDLHYSASHSHQLAGPSQRTCSPFCFPKDLKKPGFTLLQNDTSICTQFSKEEQIFPCPTVGIRILLDTQVLKLSLKQIS